MFRLLVLWRPNQYSLKALMRQKEQHWQMKPQAGCFKISRNKTNTSIEKGLFFTILCVRPDERPLKINCTMCVSQEFLRTLQRGDLFKYVENFFPKTNIFSKC